MGTDKNIKFDTPTTSYNSLAYIGVMMIKSRAFDLVIGELVEFPYIKPLSKEEEQQFINIFNTAKKMNNMAEQTIENYNCITYLLERLDGMDCTMAYDIISTNYSTLFKI